MPVPAQSTLFNESAANGLTTSFPYEFMIASADDITVELDGVVTTTGFTVTGVNEETGGAIEFAVAPANGVTVLRYLNPVLKRDEDYQQLGDFQSETVDRDFDRIWLALQGMALKLGLCVQAPISSASGVLPDPVANHVIGWDEEAKGFKNFAPVDNTLLAVDLASSDLLKGVALIAGAGRVIDSIAVLKTLPKTGAKRAFVLGYYAAGDGGGGQYFLDAADTTSADNGGTIIVANDGGRWKPTQTSVISVKQFGAMGDGVTDDTAAIQAAIDNATSGGEIYFPPGVYDVTGLRIDGTSGNRTNITLRGAGSSSEIRIHAGNSANVITALSGSGFRITSLRVRGAKGRGVSGINGPSKGFWSPTTAYALNDTVEVSSSDGQTTTVAAGNLVYKCVSAHTSSAAFSTDKATKWTLVADANFNTSDQSYATRNCIYLDGVTNASVDGCEILDGVYAGVNVGTGPVQSANAGAGASYVRIENNHINNCTSAAAGGKQTYCAYVGNTVKSCTTYGIVIDDPLSSGNTIIGNTVVGCGSHGIYLYGCDMSSVVGNTVSYCAGVGILLDSAAVDNPISGNVVSNCLQGIRAYNSSIAAMIGNFCRASTQYGIAVDTMSQVALTGNVCDNNGYDGIRLTAVSAFSLSGNACFANLGEGGIYLTSCANGSISGGCMLNNNNSGSPSADGAGIRLVNSTTVSISGVTAYDSRAGGSKTQKYGVRSTGTSDAVKLAGNTLAGNATSDFSLSGTTNRVAGDTATAIAAGTPGNFSATHMLTFVQSDGSIAYVPARLGGW